VFTFLGTSVRRINENVAITVLDPTVDPVNYPHVSNAIYGFLVNSLRLRGVSISPSGLGAALVSFASALDHQTAMGARSVWSLTGLASYPMTLAPTFDTCHLIGLVGWCL
jgi:hypothetical protein